MNKYGITLKSIVLQMM